jgi:FkbM family methyltransferase
LFRRLYDTLKLDLLFNNPYQRIDINKRPYVVKKIPESFYDRVKGKILSNEAFYWDRVQNNVWEPYTYKLFDKYLDREHCYIDIGAWIGPTVLYGAQLSSHCYAIEPDPVAYPMLKENIGLNPDFSEKITLYNGCIADHTGFVNLNNMSSFIGLNTTSTIMPIDAKSSIRVPCITFNDFIEKYAIKHCNFIKMDIEGAEASVIPTMKQYLTSNKPTLYLSLHPYNFTDSIKESATIYDVIKNYQNIYTTDGKQIDEKYFFKLIDLNKSATFEIIATDIST